MWEEVSIPAKSMSSAMIVAVPVSQPRSNHFQSASPVKRIETCEKFQKSLVLALLPLAALQLLHRPLDVPLADVKEHLQGTLAVDTNIDLGIE